jgi:hypothetical protein
MNLYNLSSFIVNDEEEKKYNHITIPLYKRIKL